MAYGNDYESPGSKVPDKSRASGAKWHAEQQQTSGQSGNGGGGGGNGNTCFPGDAMVLTPNGLCPLEDVQKGDSVMSLDLDGNIVPAIVTRRFVHRVPSRLLHVVSENDVLSFWATKNHPVKTSRGWIRVKKLLPGDVLLHVNKSGDISQHAIAGVVHSERIEPVFSLRTDGDHTFIVQGCVAHSFVFLHGIRYAVSKILRLTMTNTRALPA